MVLPATYLYSMPDPPSHQQVRVRDQMRKHTVPVQLVPGMRLISRSFVLRLELGADTAMGLQSARRCPVLTYIWAYSLPRTARRSGRVGPYTRRYPRRYPRPVP
eukprot:2220278-Rhodomonas_salina.2